MFLTISLSIKLAWSCRGGGTKLKLILLNRIVHNGKDLNYHWLLKGIGMQRKHTFSRSLSSWRLWHHMWNSHWQMCRFVASSIVIPGVCPGKSHSVFVMSSDISLLFEACHTLCCHPSPWLCLTQLACPVKVRIVVSQVLSSALAYPTKDLQTMTTCTRPIPCDIWNYQPAGAATHLRIF